LRHSRLKAAEYLDFGLLERKRRRQITAEKLRLRQAVVTQFRPIPRATIPHICAQRGDLDLRPEAGSQQAILVQPLQPLGVADVGLASGNVLRSAGIEHPYMEFALLEYFEDRDTVDPGGLHNDRLRLATLARTSRQGGADHLQMS
jgi:hypothetical protein